MRDVRRNTRPTLKGLWSDLASFYSLSCETYSATPVLSGVELDPARPVSIRCRARRTAQRPTTGRRSPPRSFLFAVVRDVQRNGRGNCVGPGGCVLFAVVRDVQRNNAWLDTLTSDAKFLFAVVRDVQRNQRSRWTRHGIPFLFAVVRDVQRNARLADLHAGHLDVSIRCRARRTVQLRSCEPWSTDACMFLFAVVRDVQRKETS